MLTDGNIVIDLDDHAGLATGTFTCAALSPDPFNVFRGKVAFFTPDPVNVDAMNLVYDFDIISTSGAVLHLSGYKVLDSRMAFSPVGTWKATTTLYITITRPGDNSIVGRGKLIISARNFLDELRGFGAINPASSGGSKLHTVAPFLKSFTKNVAGYFFSPLRPLQYPKGSPSSLPTPSKPSSNPTITKTVTLTASDGVKSPLHVFDPPAGVSAADIKSTPILFIPGASVDHRIFALPTQKTSAISYFTNKGYSCYVLVHRVGKREEAKNGWSVYDVRNDIRAAVEFVKDVASAGIPPYVVAHCMGSAAMGMALLDGTVPTSWIQGVTASQGRSNSSFKRCRASIGQFN